MVPFPQLLTPCAVTLPLTAVPTYDTVMLVVPWPDIMVPPVGTVHSTDVALEGIDDIVYVYTLFGQGAVCITSITLGVEGVSLVIDNVLATLVPQPFVAVTDIVPLVNEAG